MSDPCIVGILVQDFILTICDVYSSDDTHSPIGYCMIDSGAIETPALPV